MYIIIVGAGDIGSQVLDLLTRTQNELVVIETDSDVAEQVSRDYDALVLNADATMKETLIDAGAEQADAVITTTDQDATNIMVMLLAEELDIESKVSVVQNPEHMEIFRRIGVNVLENPQRLIGEYLVRAVQRPSVKDFMSLAGGAEVFEITVTETSPIAEKTLQEADSAGLLGNDVLVVAIERGEEVLTPRGETVIHAGDLLTVFSKEGVTGEVMHTFTGKDE
ncbi:TrkA domain-containing protein [Haloferax prahovense DSM 18310]|uniref:TrkA domain-containing protein n=1 Tax=Haloferax prahovense (strain DSM 18310 / JCM 13924 / TL6) TaxID=1227461 RepID=M0GCQ4_HALPT|nr:TrkA family potassium uptake protein [Haloferax prahovense]ELZ68584.1 TrkA domain-containing protein [Haloferax prahovense DSM 18310]